MNQAKLLRKLCAVPLGLAAACASLIFLMAAVGIQDTIEENRAIDAHMRAASQYVDRFRLERGRFPARHELEAWTKGRPLSGFGISIIAEGSGSCEGSNRELGRAPKGSYTVGYWRGEWMECYAPWSGESMLSFDEGDYFLLGNRFADMLVAAFVASAFWTGAKWLWAGKTGPFRVRPGKGVS
jgi:hypothetical protein